MSQVEVEDNNDGANLSRTPPLRRRNSKRYMKKILIKKHFIQKVRIHFRKSLLQVNLVQAKLVIIIKKKEDTRFGLDQLLQAQ